MGYSYICMECGSENSQETVLFNMNSLLYGSNEGTHAINLYMTLNELREVTGSKDGNEKVEDISERITFTYRQLVEFLSNSNCGSLSEFKEISFNELKGYILGEKREDGNFSSENAYSMGGPNVIIDEETMLHGDVENLYDWVNYITKETLDLKEYIFIEEVIRDIRNIFEHNTSKKNNDFDEKNKVYLLLEKIKNKVKAGEEALRKDLESIIQIFDTPSKTLSFKIQLLKSGEDDTLVTGYVLD